MDNLLAQVDTLSEDVFSQLMDEVPVKTVTPENLIGSSKPAAEKPSDKEQDQRNENEKGVKGDHKKETKEETTQRDKLPEEAEREITDAIGDEENEQSPKEGQPKEPAKDENETAAPSSSDILQKKAEGLIERGIWRDFEGREEFEWTDENYGDLAVQQAVWTAEDHFNELVDATGVYGKAIFNFIQNGGNPEEVIDLFKESKKIQSIDVTTEEGRTQLITDYYRGLGWSAAKVKRFIDASVDAGTLEEDAEEVKVLIEEDIKKQVASKQKEQEAYMAQQKEAEDTFSRNITSALKQRADLTSEQKRDIAQSLLVYNKKLPNGRVVNQFTLDFATLQNNPSKYIDLVLFVKDHEGYLEALSKKEEKKAVKKVWNFVKGNSAIQRSTGTSHSKPEEKQKNDLVIDYRSLLS